MREGEGEGEGVGVGDALFLRMHAETVNAEIHVQEKKRSIQSISIINQLGEFLTKLPVPVPVPPSQFSLE